MGGYVVSRILKQIQCKECKLAVEDSVEDSLDPEIGRLIRLKDRGGLKTPSNSTFQVIVKAEGIFLNEVARKKSLPDTPNLLSYITSKVLRVLDVGKLFPTLNEHSLDLNPAIEEMHHVSLCKLIVFRFLKVRCLAHCNVINRRANSISSRNKNLKATHFRNQ